jgi:Tol biopolymer transport system component
MLFGWQLYVMRPDGKDSRQITEGGNPFCARFSPDGRRLLYTNGPPPERRGIWFVDLDGENRRRIFPIGNATASACWSPDGQRMAVAISSVPHLYRIAVIVSAPLASITYRLSSTNSMAYRRRGRIRNKRSRPR